MFATVPTGNSKSEYQNPKLHQKSIPTFAKSRLLVAMCWNPIATYGEGKA
jgi:hypothetical protein